MCLIIYAPKGTDKNQEFLEEAIKKAAEFNKDGMGYAVKYSDNALWINKGFFDVEEFIKDIKENDIKEDDELLIHLRIGNVGEVDVSMCHPFLISNVPDEIVTTDEGWVDKPVLAHNGTMSKYKVKDSKYSDTFHFIEQVLSKDSVMNFMVSDSETFDDLMQSHLLSSRLAVMFPDERETVLLGTWYNEEGFMFSKNYYEEYFKKSYNVNFTQSRLDAIRNSKYNNNDYGYDDWDYDEEYRMWIHKNDSLINKQKKLDFEINDYEPSKIISIPKLSYPRPSYISLGGNGVEYTLYMGLFLPNVITEYRTFNVEINEDTITAIKIYVMADSKYYGIQRGFNYDLYDCGIFNITVRDTLSGEVIDIPRSEFYDIFDTYIPNKDKAFFNEYYDWVVTTPVTKTCLKKLDKRFSVALSYRHDKLKFKDSEMSKDVAEMFLKEGKKELDIQKNPHKLFF